ncbi:MAG TPA: hypothetical protein PK904_15175 [Bacteroidales bacterium]|nr:hypothetical protein [Bacteroidales bacterium]
MKLIYKILFVLVSALLIAVSLSAQAPIPPETGGTGSGQQIGGSGTIPSPPGPGNGQQIGGSGTIPSPPDPGNGQQIGGSGTIPEPPGPGGGQQIGGSGTIPEPPGPGSGTQIGGSGSVPYPPDPGSGYPMGTLIHSLNIPAGWSGISSIVHPFIPELDSIFPQEIEDNLAILQHFTRVYWPDFGINTIGTWESNDGYAIKALNNIQVTLIGLPVVNRTVEFNSGWNFLPILSECSVETEYLFSELVSQNSLIIVSEIGSTGLYWPEASVNNLPLLYPGLAYMVKVNQPCSVTFPLCESQQGTPNGGGTAKASLNAPWEVVAGTNSQQFLLIQGGSPMLQTGDMIGAFTTEGLCAGFAEISDSSTNMAIVLFGDDSSTSVKDGFNNDELVNLILYRPSENLTLELVIPAIQFQSGATKIINIGQLKIISD